MTVVVVGAGIAGAAAARTLRRRGVETIVLEASDAVGGRTRTVEHDGFAIDSGAIFVMGSYAATLRFLREAGHARQMSRWVARTAILDERGRKTRVRFDQPWTLAKLPQLTWGDRLRLARGIAKLTVRRGPGPFDIDDLAAADDGRTLAQWAGANFGDRVFEYAVRPLMGPLTGAAPEVISAAFTIALMSQVQRTQLTVPPGGMGRIAGWLLEGADVRLGTPVLKIEETASGATVGVPEGQIEADAVVVATDVLTARSLVEGCAPPSVLAALDRIVPIPTYHVLLGYRRDPWPSTDHDLVVRAGAGLHHNFGVLLNSRRSPGSCPAGGQTVSVYFDHAQAPNLTDHQVVALAREATDQAFGPAEPDFVHVFALDAGLIAPVPGHYAAMRAARDAMPARIRLAGDYLTHSGIEGALLSGERAAIGLL
ncbi:MAG: protoporphyrinogen/coproporphyrinogen oxidase [Sporichthyaceae bacterium]